MIFRTRRNVVNLRQLNVKFIPIYVDTNNSIVVGYYFQGLTLRHKGVGQLAEDVTDEVCKFSFIHVDTGIMEFTSSFHTWRQRLQHREDLSKYDQIGLIYPFLEIDPQEVKDLNLTSVRVLTRLLDHQVKGDEIVKGLKALSIEIPELKIQESYLGGWNIQMRGITCTIGNLIDTLNGLR